MIDLTFDIGIYKGATFDEDGALSSTAKCAERILKGENFKRERGEFRVEFEQIRPALACARRLLAVLQGLEITVCGDSQFLHLTFDSFKSGVLESERASDLSKEALALL